MEKTEQTQLLATAEGQIRELEPALDHARAQMERIRIRCGDPDCALNESIAGIMEAGVLVHDVQTCRRFLDTIREAMADLVEGMDGEVEQPRQIVRHANQLSAGFASIEKAAWDLSYEGVENAAVTLVNRIREAAIDSVGTDAEGEPDDCQTPRLSKAILRVAS